MDLNDDQRVNAGDRALMVKAMNAYKHRVYRVRFDLNADGAVDRADRDIVELYIEATGGVPCA